jgi:hypothetical protein
MKKILTIMACLAILPATSARADNDCLVSIADWQPLAAVTQLAEDNGWTVRELEIDDGCYEIEARDAEGRWFEVTIHPATLEVIAFEYEDEDDDGRRDGRDQHDDD